MDSKTYSEPDNRLFRVNGSGPDLLFDVLSLALKTVGQKEFASYYIDPKKGFVFQWLQHDKGNDISGKTPKEVIRMVMDYLDTPSAQDVENGDWENAYRDYDVIDEEGWVVYCEDWGHIGNDHYAIVAVKKAYLWYGK